MSSLLTLPERLEAIVKFAVPYAVLGFLVFLSTVSLPYPFTGAVKPPLFLIALYYWCLYRPGLMPVWFVFTAGLLLDLLGGLPLGLNALIFVVARWVILDQRRFLMGQSFIVVWIVFCILLFSSYVVQWIIFGLLNGAWPSIQPIFFSVFLGIMVFPFVSLLLHLTLKILPVPPQESDASAFGTGRFQ